MDFRRAEHELRELQTAHDGGSLDEETFRIEVAKLTLRDEDGVVWMLDPESGTWICNRGDGWAPRNPHEAAVVLEPQPAGPDLQGVEPRSVVRWVALGLALLLLLVAAVAVLWRLGLLDEWGLLSGSQSPGTQAQVTIASPPDGSQVPVGKQVSIESLIEGDPDLQTVNRVELQVEGQQVFSQAVQFSLQPDQTTLPLSPSWRPGSVGEYRVSVVAFSEDGNALGKDTITLLVTEVVDEPLPETACVPGATFLRDVNIPPGAAFPPGVWREKVWQVRNAGSCAWGEGYTLVLREGQRLSAPAHVAVPATVAGESAEIRLTFQVPEAPGVYASTWQLQAPDGEFFGPTLSLSIAVEAQVEENPPPDAPAGLQAEVPPAGDAVLLTWEDRSDNEDGFRIYREDFEANIALTRANVQVYRDEDVACGNTYRYYVVAFNASGPSPRSQPVSAVLPPCVPAGTPSVTTTPQTPADLTSTPLALATATTLPSPSVTPPAILLDQPPTLTLTVTPTEVLTSGVFTITFRAVDDWGMDRVLVWGVETGDPELDTGRIFTCQETTCTGNWPIAWIDRRGPPGMSATWTLVALAVDSSGQQSELAQTAVSIRLPDQQP